MGLADENAVWDAGKEIRSADTKTLKLICTWYDSENQDVKGSYKLPHHRAGDKKAVWKGVAAAMAALLGARGGVNIPSGDRRGVYNHLVKHYKAFDKKPPEFKEIDILILDRLDEFEKKIEDLQESKSENKENYIQELFGKRPDDQETNDQKDAEDENRGQETSGPEAKSEPRTIASLFKAGEKA